MRRPRLGDGRYPRLYHVGSRNHDRARGEKLFTSDVLNNIVNLFPLSVYIDDVPEHASLKERLLSRVKALAPYQPDSRYAWTGDVKGHGFIHQEEDFKPWIDAMVPHLHRYLELLRLRTEYLDVFFQRSWPTVTNRRQEIGSHNHENAHISLVYYLNSPRTPGD